MELSIEAGDKVKEFSVFFEKKFKDDLQKRGIIDSGNLRSGFRTEIAKNGDGYQINVYFSQYGRVLDAFAYRRAFKYRQDSLILKKRSKYKWWSNEFKKVFTQFIEEMTAEYADEVLSKFFKALDFDNRVFGG